MARLARTDFSRYLISPLPPDAWKSYDLPGVGRLAFEGLNLRAQTMRSGIRSSMRTVIAISIFVLFVCGMPRAASAQDRLKQMPGYEQYQRISRAIPSSVTLGSVSVTWKEDGSSFEYQHAGKRFRYDIASAMLTELPRPATAVTRPAATAGRRGGVGGVARGRQAPFALSPDGKLKAFYRDHNLWLADASGAIEMQITTDGSDKTRIKYATATWVYGEELEQRTAMWWSPDGNKIAYYRFDESHVPDYFLQLNQTRLQDGLDVEAFPRPGDPNPVVDLFIYDIHNKTTTRVDVRDGAMFDDSVIGHYVYRVSWSADSSELLFNRTNRRQNKMEFAAADAQTGKCRTIVREEWPASWVANSPAIQFLKGGKRFIWASERTGWKNFYLYDIRGKLLATLTDHTFEVADFVRVDEKAKILYYTARDGDNPMKLQLHRVGLDGNDDRRLTDPAFHHTVDVAPDCTHFVDVAQTHDSPPISRLMDSQGNVVAELAASNSSKFNELQLRPVELLTFKSADGQTELYGLLHRPTNFDPLKKYPLLVSVYGGPATNAAKETFTLPSALTELGFLVASFDSRDAGGRGKKFLDAIYQKFGTIEIDDQAAGVKSLFDRSYVDKSRVGIFGMSYGGYASAMCLARYPDVFRAACASSPVTDFRNYDSIYTERYMWLPKENQAGYDFASIMTHADNLKGRLMLFYGTADNNVHPSNTLQLVTALQRAGKSFDLQVGPDLGHSPLRQERMMEFFIDNLGTAVKSED